MNKSPKPEDVIVGAFYTVLDGGALPSFQTPKMVGIVAAMTEVLNLPPEQATPAFARIGIQVVGILNRRAMASVNSEKVFAQMRDTLRPSQ